MGNSYSNFAERRLKNLSTDDELKIGFVPNVEIKANKPETNKPQAKYSNPYEEYIKTWEPGDVIPLVPPGKKMQFCNFNPNTLDVDTTFFQSTHRHVSPTKFKSGEPDDIEYKVLGRKLKDNLESLLKRAARSRGLWVDDKNKLRCPPGTPAANQFTDITGSNCFIPSPRTAAQSGARAVRRTVNAAAQMSTPVGGRNETGFNAARATSQQIQELGFERVQELMAVGGRISPTSEAISGSMRIPSPFAVRGIPKPSTGVPKSKRKAPKGGTHPDSGHAVWQLGLREQIWRGRRATELARDTRERAQKYYKRADALRLPPNPVNPQGRPVGDISEKNQFVSVMSELFPNVPTSEIEEMFDQAIPQYLSRRDRGKLKQGLLQYWYSFIAEAIANPEQAKWVTTMQIDHKMGSAFEVQFDAFAPSPATGGRRITQAAANAAQKRGQNYQQGGLQLALKMNPFEMWKQMNQSGFDRNGRVNGVADSVEGDMHYMATHEFGHLMHFASVMDTLGFQTQNLQRYQMARKLVAVQGGPPQWRRENYVNAWIVDFRQATNPTGNPSIQLLIDSAQRLSTRQYARTGTWGNVTGYTRQDLEEDLNNFHNALAEAIENNITDNADDQELMRQFSGGVYAASSNIEARAEYYAARRLFGDPALTGGQTGLPATVDTFADTMSRAQGSTQTAAQIRKQLDDIGEATFNVSGNKWNITGRMAGSSLPQQPTLKTQAVRRAVDQDYPRRRRNQNNSSIVGRMQSGSQNDRTVGSRDWKNQDTLSSPNTNNPNTAVGKERPMIPMMLQSALGPNAVRDWKANPPRTDAERREWEEYINRVRFAAPADEPNTPISGSMSTSRIKKNKQGVPQYPRTPTYGPMLGGAEQIFEGISSWDEFRKKYDDQEIVFLDYETTGLVFDTYGRALENGNPVEIGAIKVKNGQVIDRFNVFVNPGKPLQQWSKDNLRDADGNPLTDEYLQGMESLESGHRKLVEFAGPNAIMGVQNAAYDKNVLEDTLREAGIDWQAKGWIDLKDMAAMTLPRYSKENPDGPFRFDKELQENVPSNGLADITKYLGVPLGKEHHRADKDAEATAESMRRLIDGAIQKNWSTDALSANKRKEYVKRTQDTFDSDVKEWESELSKYLGGGISGKMSSRSPALRATPEFGKRQTREYYSSLSERTSWRPETLEQSEPARIQNRRAIIGRMKNFLNSGDEQMSDMMYREPIPGTKEWDELKRQGDLARASGDPRWIFDENGFVVGQRQNFISRYDDPMSPDYIGDRFGGPPKGSSGAKPMLEVMNGLDPSFGDYIRKTDEQELIADLRQAAIQFHAGIDPKPRINTDTASLMEIMQNGLKRDDSSKPRRLSERMKAYEADIGISPDLPDGQRPIVGYVVHSDADFAHGEETFKEFSNKVDVNSPRYKFNLFDPKTTNTNNGFNSVFGDAEIILKPEVGERTAYGNGDALDNHVYPVLINSTDSDEIGRALIDPHGRFDERDSHVVELLYGKFKNDFNAYRKDNGKTRPQINGVWSNRDALIAGGVNPDDIEEVRVPFRSLDTTNSTTAGEIAKKPRQLKYLPATEYVDEEPRVMVASPPAAASPPDDPNDPNRISKEELDKIQEKMKRSFAATKDEQKIIENILSGMEPMNAIPRDIAVRINNVDRFAKLTDDFKNLQKIEEAEKLQMLAKTRGIALSITNNFGLDIFDGRSFYRNSAKSKSSKEVLEKQIDKQIEELIETMRQEKFKNIKNISDVQKRLETMQKEFDNLTNKPNSGTTSQEPPDVVATVQMRFDVSKSSKASEMTYSPWDNSVRVIYKDGRIRKFIDVPYERARQAGSSEMIDEFIADMESGKIGIEDEE